jgi:hypothetical protein
VLKLGKRQTAFGKKCANLSLKFGVLIADEIEQQFFCEPVTFFFAKKVFVKMTLDGMVSNTEFRQG